MLTPNVMVDPTRKDHVVDGCGEGLEFRFGNVLH